jgi:hypothetical protein
LPVEHFNVKLVIEIEKLPLEELECPVRMFAAMLYNSRPSLFAAIDP